MVKQKNGIMTAIELQQTCFNKGISFIPHHECGVCGQPTGWYLFERWPPYEVAYSSACGCGDSGARRSSWQEILDWVCKEDGTLKKDYEYLQPEPVEHKPSAIERIKAELLKRKDKYTKRGDESDANHDGKGMFWGGVTSAFNEVLTVIEQIEREG